MHEVSIAAGVIEIISAECLKKGYGRVDSVNLRVGRASGVLPDALIFAFDAMKADSVADGAVLSIEEVPLGGECRDCSGSFTSEAEYVLKCPLCGGTSFSITSGRELDVVDMEVS